MFFLYELGTRQSEAKGSTKEEMQVQNRNFERYEAFAKMAIAVNLNAESNAVLNNQKQ